MTPAKRFACWSIFLFARFISSGSANAQAIADTVAPLLEKPVQPTAVTAFQLQSYMMKHIAKPVVPATAAQWTAEAQKFRKHILEDLETSMAASRQF